MIRYKGSGVKTLGAWLGRSQRKHVGEANRKQDLLLIQSCRCQCCSVERSTTLTLSFIQTANSGIKNLLKEIKLKSSEYLCDTRLQAYSNTLIHTEEEGNDLNTQENIILIEKVGYLNISVMSGWIIYAFTALAGVLCFVFVVK